MAKSGDNFFYALLSKIFETSDPEVIKKRKLKSIAKALSKSRFNKFYKAGSGEALPQFAKFFYDIYKAIAASQNMLKNMPNEAQIKNDIIDFFQTERQKKLAELLTEESILEKSKQIPVNKLVPQVKQAVEQYCSEFTAEKIAGIEALYKQFLEFKDFCIYDYYFILKKFDSSLRENEFSTAPQFQKINAEYIGEDLKDFITVAWVLPFDADWNMLINLFKKMRDFEPITAATFKKITMRVAQLKNSRSLEMIIQLITKDPLYEPKLKTSWPTIAETYIEKFKLEIYGILRKLEAAEKDSKVNNLLKQVFGTESVSYLKNYSSTYSQNLEKKNLRGFSYCDPLNYLKGFLLEYVKKDLRVFYDLVGVRGQWTATNVSQAMSNAYNDLLTTSETITSFDANLSEEGSVGIKIKTLLPRTVKEADARNIINRLVGDANDLAKEYITESTKNLITVAKVIKSLIEDAGKKSPEMIGNWQELERAADHPLREMGAAIYKKIYIFAQLMQVCMGGAS